MSRKEELVEYRLYLQANGICTIRFGAINTDRDQGMVLRLFDNNMFWLRTHIDGQAFHNTMYKTIASRRGTGSSEETLAT